MAGDGAHIKMFGLAGGRGRSFLGFIAAMAVLTAIAAGVGGALGIGLIAQVKTMVVAQEHARDMPDGPPPKYGRDMILLDLPPVITNLAEPATAWVRLQASIIYDNKAVPKPQMLAAQIGEDILAYMKTVTLAQIGGASGLEHLREDLNERASVRSDGHVRELIIQTVVVQ